MQEIRDWEVCRLAFQMAERIQAAPKSFPPREKFALTSQIRRSSRSVALNLREAWAKRRHESHFIAKLSDCDGENSETETALDFAWSCKYLTEREHAELVAMNRQVGRLLGRMLRNAHTFPPGPKNKKGTT